MVTAEGGRGIQVGDRYAGCLLGGAVGDALGAAVEFMRWPEIVRRFGPEGIRDYASTHFLAGQVTDDTQMTLATARGLVGAQSALAQGDFAPVSAAVHAQYLLWFQLQNDPAWRRGPGHTCLAALGSGIAGSVDHPINDSKGCGGVMRVAPVGLALPGQPDEAFELGVATAALTHGHPGGYFPAGLMAALISRIVTGEGLLAAIDEEVARRAGRLDANTKRLVHAARTLAAEGVQPHRAWSELGEGWTGDEALAIALYGALRHPDSLEEAVVVTVNHSGDSDSTGSICGALLGCALGPGAIPARWLETLEHRAELAELGRAMADIFSPKTA